MKPKLTALLGWTFLFCCLCQMPAFGQGAAFTYEGQFDIGGAPVTGTYDFQFSLYDAATNGNLIAGPIGLPAVGVNNGVYLVSLNFGSALNGAALWLESDERVTGGQGAYTPIVPRQELTPVPYAVFAETASNLSGTISSGGLAGTYTNSVTFYSASGNFSGSFFGTIAGNGSGLTSLNAANLTGTVPVTGLAGPYNGTVTISNSSDIFAGKMIGDGSGLTNLSYSHLGGPLPAVIITNFQTTADLSGSFFGSLGGNGSQITSLNATNLTGNVQSKSLSGAYSNAVTFSNALNKFVGKMVGDGSGLTNLPIGGVLPSGIVTNNETGVTLNGAFSGNGSLLTSLNATSLVGILPSNGLAGNYANGLIFSNAADVFIGKVVGDGSGLTNLPIGGVLPSGIVTNNESGVNLNGAFSGNGSLLTSLNATNLVGTVPSNGLAGTYTSGLSFSNASDLFIGKMVGDGSGLTNLPISGVLPGGIITNSETGVILSGTFSGNGAGLTNLPIGGVLPTAIVTNNETGVTLNGAFSGNGSLLTSLNATNIVGTMPSNSLAGTYTNVVVFSNAVDVFAGKMIGDGSGLTNLPVGGVLPTAIVTNNETGVTLSGAFNGNGSGLTNLSYSHISGPLPGAVITNNQVTANLSGSFFGSLGGNGSAITSVNATNLSGVVQSKSLSGSYSNAVTFSNTLNTFVGKMVGDGSGLTNLPTGGVLPTAIVTNNEFGVTLNGAFGGNISGNGNGLTALSAASLTGSVPGVSFAGTYNNSVLISNASDVFAGKMIGDGSGLTNLPIGGVLPAAIVTNNEFGVILNGAFGGNGILLTSLNATNLIGTVPSNGLAGTYTNGLTFSNASDLFIGKMIGDGSGLTNLPIGGVLPTAIVTNNEFGVTLNGAFGGNGSLLTSLNATNLVGTVPSNGLAGTYTNGLTFSNASDLFIGKMVGDGSGLTNLPIDGILPGAFVTNNESGVVLSGSFSGAISGNGSGLTLLNAVSLVGSIPAGILAGAYTNSVTFSNASGNFNGIISGNGAGLTNLPGNGIPASAIVTNNASGVTLAGSFSGVLSGNGSGITNLVVSGGTPGILRDTTGSTNMIIATNAGGKIYLGAPPQIANLFSNDSTNGITFDFGSFKGPEIIVPSGSTTMFKFGARELQGTGGSSGVYFMPVQTNVAGFLDVMPSGASGSFSGSSVQASWIDILDRSLARNDSSNYIALHLGMGQFQGVNGETAYISVNNGGTNARVPLAIGATNIQFRVTPTVGGAGSDMADLNYNNGTILQVLYDSGGNNAIVNAAGNTTTTEATTYDPRWELRWGAGIGLAVNKTGIMEVNNGVSISNFGQFASLVAANLMSVNTNMANYGVVTNDLVSQHFVGRTNQLPTVVAGPGAGSGATVSIVGSDSGGQVTVTTGASPGSAAVVATVTFGKAFPDTTFPVVCPANASAGQLGVLPYVTGASTGWTLNIGSTGLAPSTVYSYTYNVVGSQ